MVNLISGNNFFRNINFFVTIQLTIIILLADPSENAIYGKSTTLRVQLLLHPTSRSNVNQDSVCENLGHSCITKTRKLILWKSY